MGVRDRGPKPCIVIDTREKLPWQFDTSRVDITIGTLQTGDYSLWTHEAEICIERKSLDDLVMTLIHERDRFKRELERMQFYPRRAIIVEGAWRDVRDHNYTSLATPDSLFGLMCCLMIDYNVPILMCEDRPVAGRVCERMIRRYAENLERARLECLSDSHGTDVPPTA